MTGAESSDQISKLSESAREQSYHILQKKSALSNNIKSAKEVSMAKRYQKRSHRFQTYRSDIDDYSDLQETTKTARRNLLLTSLISIIIATTGLLPKQISALGVELQDIDQISFLVILLLTVIYFVITFSFYAYSDLVRTFWKTIYFFRVALPEIEKTATYVQHAASDFSIEDSESSKYAITIADLDSLVKEAREAKYEVQRLYEKLYPIFKDIKWSHLRRLLKRTHVIRIVIDTALPLIVGLVSIGFLIDAVAKR